MNFKEYDNFIEQHKNDMLFFIIYYNLKCNDDFEGLKDPEKEEIISFVHSAYFKDESGIDLGCICDTALEYKDDILKNSDDFTVWDLLQNSAIVF